jgi:AraC family transcriptional regulator, positive regulator of tynA and feaB
VNQRVGADDGAWRALSWSWSPLEWGWLPSAGAYRPRLGGPSRSVSLRIDTRHAAPTERFDLWCDVTRNGYDYARLEQSSGLIFQGSGVVFLATCGHLIISASSPVTVVRTQAQAREAGESITIGYIVEGERLAQSPGDTTQIATAGEFYIEDSARRLDAIYPTRQKAAHLTLPRAEVAAQFGGQAPQPSAILAALNASRLAPVIQSQFATAARHSGLFTDAEGGAAVMALRSLVITAIAAGGEQTALEATAAPAIVIAAKRHIETHLGDPGLEVDDVAHAAGCSRSTLYRVFAEAGVGVAETIRDLRLDRLRRLLEAEPISVTEAAARCGFSDLRTLQRQFKARFGVSAREFQARARGL